MKAAIDHLVVTAPTLKAARDWVEETLGVPGDSLYLEAIAPSPAAPPPERRRWFGLDDLAPDAEARLATWVVRTDDLQAAAGSVEPSLVDAIEPLSRGPFKWLITIPRDGRMPLNGLAPTLIEWRTPVHPATSLIDRGCRLVRLIAHDREPDQVRDWLTRLGLEHVVDVRVGDARTGPWLVAEIATPAGIRSLGARAAISR
jgi:hypothetical protein